VRSIDKKIDPELLDLLNEFKDCVYANIDKATPHGKPDENQYHTELEYLNEIKEKDSRNEHEGFPEIIYTYSLRPEYVTEDFNDKLNKIKFDITNFLGARNQAVALYYPENGYMGWHHNANARGFNILISHSEDGKGFFKYQDPATKEIVTMHDSVGWNFKVGYYGGWNEPDKIFWHCARTFDTPRLTLGYIIPNEDMWNGMAEDIFIET
jgi:hypothetical protein